MQKEIEFNNVRHLLVLIYLEFLYINEGSIYIPTKLIYILKEKKTGKEKFQTRSY